MSIRKGPGTWALLRLSLPPWQGQDSPLIAYDLKPDRREGRRPWALMILAHLTLFALGSYLLILLLEPDSFPPLSELLGVTISIILGGGAVMVMVGHWRLILAISSRTAAAIAGRKRNGDWDLIAITPMAKSQWLRSQVVIIAWQVFPVVRQLLIVQGIMSLIGLSTLTYLMTTLQDEGSTWGNDAYLPAWLYLLLMIPVFLFFVLEPLITAYSFITMGLYNSSLSGRVSTSMFGHLMSIALQRILMSASFIYGGLFWLVSLGSLVNILGLTDDFDLEPSVEGFIGVVVILCSIMLLYVLMLAPVAEWLPLIGVLLMMSELEPLVHGVIYTAGIITCLQTYLLLPLLQNRFYYRWAVGRLERRSLN